MKAMCKYASGVTTIKGHPENVKENANFSTHGVMFLPFSFEICQVYTIFVILCMKAIMSCYDVESWYNTSYLT